MGQFFDELRRRNVFRVAVAYLVAAWLVLQVADLVLDSTSAPDWVMQAFILLFALGLPIVLIFSWVYELTPEGLKLEKDVDRDSSVTHQTARRLNQITIGLLVIVVGFVAAERVLVTHGAGESAARPVAEITDKSIAVLAFDDLSEHGDQGYFADGLSEELLNVLSQVPDLQVAGRTSSFAFKGQNKDLREIGDILNVAHILEGSVRKSGNRIRVTAQLINAETGFHLFSESYDRNLDDVFAVQDELAEKISTALHSELVGTSAIVDSTPTEIETYDLYLEARQKIHTRNRELMEEAVSLLDKALEIDPDYVPALTQKALVVYLLSDANGAYGDIPVEEAIAVSRPLLERALAIDDRYAEAHAISGLIMDEEGKTTDEQIVALRRAVALNPGIDDARNWLSTALTNKREFDESTVLLEGIVERDPMYGPAFNNLIQMYMRNREFDRADALIDRVERITGDTNDIEHARGFVAFVRGRLADAVRHLKPVYESNPSATIVQFFYGITLESLGDYEAFGELGNPYFQVIAKTINGDPEGAGELLQRLMDVAGIEDTFEIACEHYVYTAEPESIAALVDEQFGGVDALLERLPKSDDNDLGYMPNLAWAYLQLGRQSDYDKVAAAMRDALAIFNADSPKLMPVVYSNSDYAAVTGDADLLVETARRLVDFDAADVEPFRFPYYEPYFDIEEFRAMNDIIVQRANDERSKLGMDTYVPPGDSALR